MALAVQKTGNLFSGKPLSRAYATAASRSNLEKFSVLQACVSTSSVFKIFLIFHRTNSRTKTLSIDVWNTNLLLLHEQIMETSSPTSKISLLEDWLKSKIQLHNLQEAKVWNKLSPKLKNASLPLQPYLASVMGYSHKHTIKLFKEKCGLPPKMIQRIFRFNNVLMHAQTSGLNWTALSHDAGYTDQSHFIKDFKQFTGLTPKTFLQQRPKDWMLLRESR